MTGRERIFATLAGQPVDRFAAMPITMMWAADLVGAKYRDYATRAEIQAAGQCAAARQFGIDHVSVISDPGCEAAYFKVPNPNDPKFVEDELFGS